MAAAGTLHDAFIDELRDTYDAERQLLKTLPKLAKASTSPELRAASESHLEETRGQVERLEQVFESLDEKVRGKHCDGIAGIIEEGKTVMEEEFDDATMDACLIAAGHAEHYEIAAYGTLVAWARAMGHTEAADLLQQTLDEEEEADKKLSALAEGGINQTAASVAHPPEGEDASKTASAKKPAARAADAGKTGICFPPPSGRTSRTDGWRYVGDGERRACQGAPPYRLDAPSSPSMVCTTSRSCWKSTKSALKRRPSVVPACVRRSRSTTRIAASAPLRCSRR
jgi:ferritin-like metal-binding protein YciE